MRLHLITSAFAALMLAGAPQAHAGPIHDPIVSTCIGANCSSVVLGGTLLSLGTGSAGQWVQEIFASAGQCLRIQVTNEFSDLAMDVIAPNGALYSNDEGNISTCPSCPLVKISSAPRTGWYTVNISHYAGSAVEGSFTLAYGAYPRGNPNCASPTAPLSAAAPASERRSAGGGEAPRNAPPSR